MKLGPYNGAWSTQHSGTTFVAISKTRVFLLSNRMKIGQTVHCILLIKRSLCTNRYPEGTRKLRCETNMFFSHFRPIFTCLGVYSKKIGFRLSRRVGVCLFMHERLFSTIQYPLAQYLLAYIPWTATQSLRSSSGGKRTTCLRSRPECRDAFARLWRSYFKVPSGKFFCFFALNVWNTK